MNGSGEIDDLYQFLEQSGSHYVSLLAQVVPSDASAASPADSYSLPHSPCCPTPSNPPPRKLLFNKTLLGHTKDQVDVVIAADEEQDMLSVVSDH
jgi:hypothetical protein